VYASMYCDPAECPSNGITMRFKIRGPGGYASDYRGDDWWERAWNYWYQPYVGTPGTYTFTYQYSVPSDALAALWGVRQVKVSKTFTRTVKRCQR